MSIRNNNIIALITVAIILISAVGYTIYDKFSASDEINTGEAVGNTSQVSLNSSSEVVSINDNNHEESDHIATDITGKVISVNTNADNKTFVKVKSYTNADTYMLLTSLDPQLVNINIGDVISFSDNLDQSTNQEYYFLNKLDDYSIVEKSDYIKTGPKAVTIADIDSSMEGSDVLLRAQVMDLTTSKKGHSFLTLVDQGYKLKGVLFKSEANQLEDRLGLLKKYSKTSNKLIVEGKVSIYKGELQIIISKVYT